MKTLLMLFVTAVALTGVAKAQLSTEEIAVVQGLFGMEKRAIMTKMIQMSPSDSVAFWPLYEKYEEDRKNIGKKRITLIQDFVGKYPAISNEEINTIMTDALEMEEDQHDLLDTYYNKIRKASSATVAAQWLQIESYINAAVRLAIQEKLPFVGGIKKK